MEMERDTSIDVKNAINIAKQAANSKSDKKSLQVSSMDNYKHGDIYVEDGKAAGIVIENNHRLNEMAKGDGTLNAVKNLGDETDMLFDKMDGDCHMSDLSKDPALEFIKQNPDSEAALKLIETKKAFQDFGLTADGVAHKDDPRTKLYEEALEKVRKGEVVLPTVSEYEQQLKEREQRQRQVTIVPPKPKEEPKQIEEQPKEDIVEQKEDDEMSNDKRQEIIEGAAVDPLMEMPNDKKQDQVKENVSEPKKPLNLVAMEDELYNRQPVQEEPKPVTPEPKNETVVFDVPESKAETFIQNMPDEMKEKVEASKVVKVNFTRKLDLPKATRRLTNIDNYRRIAPKSVSSDVTSRILINSGYIGYFKKCGALEWSQLTPVIDDDSDEPRIDSGKVTKFCYDHLVTTSLGNISYRQFLEETSSEDIPSMLHAIMQSTLPDEQTVIMQCGRSNCRREFDATYHISELPDLDKITDDARDIVAKVTSAKDIIDDAKSVHEESCVMRKLSYTRRNDEVIFVFKHRDLANVIDRAPAADGLVEIYGESAALISAYVNEVYIKIHKEQENEWYQSNDPTIICEELYKLSTDELDEIRAILQEIPSIDAIQYSLKGDFKCPHCNAISTNPAQDIMSLVFQVALKARYLV